MSNGICVGNPTRFEKLYDNELYNNKRANNKIFTILIFGGSQGTAIFSNIARTLCKITIPLRIYHQARSSDIEKLIELYSNTSIDYTVMPFFTNIEELYQQADLVISRSGASSIFEIIGFKKPSILIPFAKSINGDQLANANFLASHHAAIVVPETLVSKTLVLEALEFNADKFMTNMPSADVSDKGPISDMLTSKIPESADYLFNIINELINNPNTLNNLYQNLCKLDFNNCTKKFVYEIKKML